ncbi:DUF1653 domain-containing protein [Candidatus Uhrbacteria bacterium]|nr:DUF1653 domain-containing protein [Candidatus Uhrbacteria bacterium]
MGTRDIKLGIYEHYKGGRVEVIALAYHSEALEEMVVYKTLYENRTHGKGSVWVRPLGMFTETVEVDGTKIQRFRFIDEEA